MRLDVTELSDIQRSRLHEAWEESRPRVLPAGWQLTEAYMQGAAYDHVGVESQLLVGVPVAQRTFRAMLSVEWVCSVEPGDVPQLWLHLSFSHAYRIPTWLELKGAKALFIGDDLKAISVLPAKAEYYNHCTNCLHLFAPLEHDPLPDFRDSDGRL